MGTNNVVFLEVIEWFDESGRSIAHRIPETGSGEIKYGAQLIVRESQAAVFFYNGKAYDAFGPGRHTLTTANFPILTKILSLPWGFTSPLRAEVYMVNMKVFPNLAWGTRDPVAFRDSELGLVRLRAHGMFNIRVVQPVLFVNTLVGTKGIYTVGDIEEYLSRAIVSRFNDYMGEKLDSLLDLPGQYDNFSDELQKRLAQDFSCFGLALNRIFINSITPPPEVQKAIDDKSRLGVFDDLNKLVKMKAAMALEKASESQGEAGAGMGMGLGFMMPAMFADAFRQGAGPGQGGPAASCPDCRQSVPDESRFCPYCGHQIVVFQKCPECGKNLPPKAKFCSACGRAVDKKQRMKKCKGCGAANLPEATFCNGCGEKL
ncbi:MAG: SPFH domain-containing protein [Syntrophaceae bacterium]